MDAEKETAGIPGIDGALAEALAKIEIPPRPVILDQVMAEMQSEEPNFHKLAGLIMSDVGLSASIIKTANAPIFGFRTKAATVREALTMLGLVMVLRTVAAHAVRQALPAPAMIKDFWETSARVAQLSGWLARELGIQFGVRPQDAFTYGLFHDCGIPVLLKACKDYDKIFTEACEETISSFTDVESTYLGFHHALVGSAMARSWYLPDPLCEAIQHHHNLAACGIPPAGQRMIALTQLAEWLQGQGTALADNEWHKTGETALGVLQITREEAEGLFQRAHEMLDQFD